MRIQDVLNKASRLLETVPYCNEKQEYSLVDMRWILADPGFTTALLFFVEDKEDSEVEEKLMIYLANVLSRKDFDWTVRVAEGHIRHFLEQFKKERK